MNTCVHTSARAHAGGETRRAELYEKRRADGSVHVGVENGAWGAGHANLRRRVDLRGFRLARVVLALSATGAPREGPQGRNGPEEVDEVDEVGFEMVSRKGVWCRSYKT